MINKEYALEKARKLNNDSDRVLRAIARADGYELNEKETENLRESWIFLKSNFQLLDRIINEEEE